ncbi:MAG: SDR family NAD(P)-dependent oxidoreductase [Hyphomicrobiaceae bacterium]
MRSVVVTGASTGIGEAIALRLGRAGWTVFAGVRQRADGERLRRMSETIYPVSLDVRKMDDITAMARHVDLTLDGRTLSGLINNAGIAQMGPLTLQPMDEIRTHFEINVLGAIAVTQALAPALGQDTSRIGSPGRIVNITSVGGQVASPFLGAYTATKHAMESVTDTLRRELKMFSIEAIAVAPGAVQTPIWDKASREDGHAYKMTPWADALDTFLSAMVAGGKRGFTADHIAAVVEEALTAARPRARYAPVPDKLVNYYALRSLPKRWVDALFVKRLGLDRPTSSSPDDR